jgi:hypothetical protein
LSKYSEELKPHIPELCKMLAIILKDQFPDLKTTVSQFISDFVKIDKKEIGAHSKMIIDSICLNTKHQHSKVRKISTISLIDVLLCDEAANLIDDCIPSLINVSSDKNKEIRKIFVQKMAELMKNLNIIYLKKYQSKLLVLLLNGISDENEEIRKLALKEIEEVGNNIKKLLEDIKPE